SIEEWNKACILAQLWDILQKRSSLWIDWVHASYLSDTSIWQKKRRYYDSWTWKHIMDCRDTLRQHIHYEVGDGSKFSFLYDPWLPSGQSIYELSGDTIRQALGLSHDSRVAHFL